MTSALLRPVRWAASVIFSSNAGSKRNCVMTVFDFMAQDSKAGSCVSRNFFYFFLERVTILVTLSA
jgi:hypothetical protein